MLFRKSNKYNASTGLVLQLTVGANNENLSMDSNGMFIFNQDVLIGSVWTVTVQAQPRSLSENRNRHEGKLGLVRFLAFLRRIAPLCDEKQLKMAQIQLFCNRFSILGQAPSNPTLQTCGLSNATGTMTASGVNNVQLNCSGTPNNWGTMKWDEGTWQ